MSSVTLLGKFSRSIFIKEEYNGNMFVMTHIAVGPGQSQTSSTRLEQRTIWSWVEPFV